MIGVSKKAQILDLPQDIFDFIFVDYLDAGNDLKNLTHFDAAICNHSDRTKYLGLVANLTFKHSYISIRGLLRLKWIFTRKIRFEKVCISETTQSDTLKDFLLYWSNIKSLKLSGSVHSTGEALSEISKYCRNLVEFTFTSTNINVSIVHTFFKLSGSTIEALYFDLPQWLVREKTTGGFSSYLHYCPKLKRVEYFSFNSELIAAGHNCPDLLEAKICHEFNVDINDQGLIALFKGCRKIQMLYIDMRSISDVVMLRATDCCRDLRNVTLVDCNTVSVVFLESLAENCPMLEKLTLLHILTPKNDLIKLFTQWSFPNLVHFNYAGRELCDVSLLDLVQKSPHLKEISIAESHHITNVGMSHIASHCHNLKELQLQLPCGADPERLVEILRNNPRLPKIRFNSE